MKIVVEIPVIAVEGTNLHSVDRHPPLALEAVPHFPGHGECVRIRVGEIDVTVSAHNMQRALGAVRS